MGMFSEEAKAKRAEKLQRLQERSAQLEFASDVSKIRGLSISDGTITYKGSGGPIVGARAAVETAGDIERRITASRIVVTGVFALAWRKKKDHRELYLTVEGQGFGFVVPVDPDEAIRARRVAARINALATESSSHTESATAHATAPAAEQPADAVDVAGQVAQLSSLHSSGALTDDEFSAAKAKLLGL